MAKTVLAWGAAATVLWGTTAWAAPKAAAGAQVNGAAGAAAAGGGAPTVAPMPGTPPGTPGAPTPGAQPLITPEAAPANPATPDPDAEEAEAEEAERREARKRARRRRAQLEAEAEADLEEEHRARVLRRPLEAPAPPVPPPAEPWRLVGPHFMLSAERLTSVLVWDVTQTVQVSTVNPSTGTTTSSTTDVSRTGTDVAFLGVGRTANVFGAPRLGIDGMLANGLTLGGSLSYFVTSGKVDSVSGTAKRTDDVATETTFVFAPRIGVMLQASPYLGVWLRGGMSRISSSSESPTTSATGNAGTVTSTLTLVNFSLDPQLVITPMPHVGITLGVPLDIGVSGTAESSSSSVVQDVKASSYGISGGLVVIL